MSEFKGFYKLTPEERLKRIIAFAGLTGEEAETLKNTGSLPFEVANRMVENVVGGYTLPLGFAPNFLINGREYIVPMVIEEPSVIAAASNGARLARVTGGFRAEVSEPIMIGQIQITDIPDIEKSILSISEEKRRLIDLANEFDPALIRAGGGARDIEVRRISTPLGEMLIIHLLVDVRDAMGANAVNTMVEGIAPRIEHLTGGKVYLRIISNLAKYRVARASARFRSEDLGGAGVVDGIIKAWGFAYADPFRCATHNKGIMNGVDAVVLATGNDFRAVEAGAHAYAMITGCYRPLTSYEKDQNGDLIGRIELPVAVGIIGGATRVHPVARINLKILGVKTAGELGCVLASVGLAQNLAALRALASEGIQKGHMRLHARNIAMSVGATPEEADRIVPRMVEEKKVNMDRARELLESLRKGVR
jgi:hydroxymethylglutaryl-CoA reductase